MEILKEAAQYDRHNPHGKHSEFLKTGKLMPSDAYTKTLKKTVKSIRSIREKLKKYNTETQRGVMHPVEGYTDGLSVADALHILTKADLWYCRKLSYVTGELDFVMPNNKPIS